MESTLLEPSVAELVMEGLGLMAVGMTIVFAFLLLLVGMLFAMSALAARLESKRELPLPSALPAAAPAGPDPRVVAAIAAAVGRYRRRVQASAAAQSRSG